MGNLYKLFNFVHHFEHGLFNSKHFLYPQSVDILMNEFETLKLNYSEFKNKIIEDKDLQADVWRIEKLLNKKILKLDADGIHVVIDEQQFNKLRYELKSKLMFMYRRYKNFVNTIRTELHEPVKSLIAGHFENFYIDKKDLLEYIDIVFKNNLDQNQKSKEEYQYVEGVFMHLYMILQDLYYLDRFIIKNEKCLQLRLRAQKLRKEIINFSIHLTRNVKLEPISENKITFTISIKPLYDYKKLDKLEFAQKWTELIKAHQELLTDILTTDKHLIDIFMFMADKYLRIIKLLSLYNKKSPYGYSKFYVQKKDGTYREINNPFYGIRKFAQLFKNNLAELNELIIDKFTKDKPISILAYRKNIDYVKELMNFTNYKNSINIDFEKYFNNIKPEHILDLYPALNDILKIDYIDIDDVYSMGIDLNFIEHLKNSIISILQTTIYRYKVEANNEEFMATEVNKFITSIILNELFNGMNNAGNVNRLGSQFIGLDINFILNNPYINIKEAFFNSYTAISSYREFYNYFLRFDNAYINSMTSHYNVYKDTHNYVHTYLKYFGSTNNPLSFKYLNLLYMNLKPETPRLYFETFITEFVNKFDKILNNNYKELFIKIGYVIRSGNVVQELSEDEYKNINAKHFTIFNERLINNKISVNYSNTIINNVLRTHFFLNAISFLRKYLDYIHTTIFRHRKLSYIIANIPLYTYLENLTFSNVSMPIDQTLILSKTTASVKDIKGKVVPFWNQFINNAGSVTFDPVINSELNIYMNIPNVFQFTTYTSTLNSSLEQLNNYIKHPNVYKIINNTLNTLNTSAQIINKNSLINLHDRLYTSNFELTTGTSTFYPFTTGDLKAFDLILEGNSFMLKNWFLSALRGFDSNVNQNIDDFYNSNIKKVTNITELSIEEMRLIKPDQVNTMLSRFNLLDKKTRTINRTFINELLHEDLENVGNLIDTLAKPIYDKLQIENGFFKQLLIYYKNTAIDPLDKNTTLSLFTQKIELLIDPDADRSANIVEILETLINKYNTLYNDLKKDPKNIKLRNEFIKVVKIYNGILDIIHQSLYKLETLFTYMHSTRLIRSLELTDKAIVSIQNKDEDQTGYEDIMILPYPSAVTPHKLLRLEERNYVLPIPISYKITQAEFGFYNSNVDKEFNTIIRDYYQPHLKQPLRFSKLFYTNIITLLAEMIYNIRSYIHLSEIGKINNNNTIEIIDYNYIIKLQENDAISLLMESHKELLKDLLQYKMSMVPFLFEDYLADIISQQPDNSLQTNDIHYNEFNIESALRFVFRAKINIASGLDNFSTLEWLNDITNDYLQSYMGQEKLPHFDFLKLVFRYLTSKIVPQDILKIQTLQHDNVKVMPLNLENISISYDIPNSYGTVPKDLLTITNRYFGVVPKEAINMNGVDSVDNVFMYPFFVDRHNLIRILFEHLVFTPVIKDTINDPDEVDTLKKGIGIPQGNPLAGDIANFQSIKQALLFNKVINDYSLLYDYYIINYSDNMFILTNDTIKTKTLNDLVTLIKKEFNKPVSLTQMVAPNIIKIRKSYVSKKYVKYSKYITGVFSILFDAVESDIQEKNLINIMSNIENKQQLMSLKYIKSGIIDPVTIVNTYKINFNKSTINDGFFRILGLNKLEDGRVTVSRKYRREVIQLIKLMYEAIKKNNNSFSIIYKDTEYTDQDILKVLGKYNWIKHVSRYHDMRIPEFVDDMVEALKTFIATNRN